VLKSGSRDEGYIEILNPDTPEMTTEN
jgi:hypothetical protein